MATRQGKRVTEGLREKAERAWQYWGHGHLPPGLEFADDGEELLCWELVRAQYLEWYPPGQVDRGYVEVGCWGWWCWDIPEAAEFPEIEGLPAEYSRRYQQLEYLKSWAMVEQGVQDAHLLNRAQEIGRYYGNRTRGKPGAWWYPFCTGVPVEKQEAKWESIQREWQAWLKLGYIREDNDDREKNHS